jgi:hypothetical protein
VLKSTGNRQEPFVYGSLGGDDVPLVPARVAPSEPALAAPSSQAEARRDYELALQIGNKAAFNAFLAQYPDGFYASLAKLQFEKIAAEEARVAATEKAQAAEAERARLAAAGAQKEAQAKAEADAKAAEQARLAAEKAKQVAQDHATEAERKRTETAAADTAAVKPATAAPSPEKATNLAALTPAPPPADVTKSVQSELRRVGCLSAEADGDWNAKSQRSLSLFNRYAGTKFDVKIASSDALDAIKQKSSRVCPLACEHGFKADGDHCSKIACADGSFLNDDNECEKRRGKTPVARRDENARADRTSRERPRAEASAAKPQAAGSAGQFVCDTSGCRGVPHGCHLEYRSFAQGGPFEGGGGNIQVCR